MTPRAELDFDHEVTGVVLLRPPVAGEFINGRGFADAWWGEVEFVGDNDMIVRIRWTIGATVHDWQPGERVHFIWE